MSILQPRLRREQVIGLVFVLALHGAALYGLWSYRIIPTPSETITLMVSLISPTIPEQPHLQKLIPPKPVPPPPEEPPPPEHKHLAAESPVTLPAEPVVYVPPPPPPPVIVVPQLPPQPLVLSGELSVVCPERTPPDYPSISTRMNEEGKVILRVELGEDGRVVSAEVKSSSGYRRLDEAALSAVKNWHCKPSVHNGVAVRAIALQPFNFMLEGK